MKICERGLDFVQITNDLGDVRICSWTRDGHIGNLIDNSFEELMNGDKAKAIRSRLISGDYCQCNVDDCPWLACGDINNHLVDIDSENQFPQALYLAFENTCNYNCSSCDIHERMLAADKTELQKRYDIIEDRIKDILPKIKCISANGQGEIFASPRILNIIKNWKPEAPADECSVIIETNGSLFDEEHWKKIENIGKYHVSVAISVMSFDEYTYQRLSGTKSSIKKVEDNLRFVKSLREKGIINHVEIATVVQERNFREMPEFARRCVDEFGADSVRLRSFVPWGKKPIEVEWFTDVINPYHPYHEEYVEIMKDPIFKHPKVHDWSGGIGTSLGEHPYKKRLDYANMKLDVLRKYMCDSQSLLERIKQIIPEESNVYIYGLGDVGNVFYKLMENKYNIICGIDKFYGCDKWNGIDVCRMDEIADLDKKAYVIITPFGDWKETKREFMLKGFDEKKVYGIEEIGL